VAPEVVTRNSGAGGYSIVTMAPDMAQYETIPDRNSAVLIKKTTASQCRHLAPLEMSLAQSTLLRQNWPRF
jgi:hypothetical protein